MKEKWLLSAALAWCVIVPVTYYFVNQAYYAEQISVFGRYFLSYLN